MEIIELTSTESGSVRAEGLTALAQVTLNPSNARILETAAAHATGDAAWQSRKRAEMRDVLALSQIAPPGRLRIGWIDMADDLCALMFMRLPVARRPKENNELRLAHEAVLGLTYRREAVQRPLPGTAFFQLLYPPDVWHPNVGPLPPNPVPLLCLGTELPAGIRCADLVLMAYGALSMQTVQIDERDTARVMSLAAARWWQQNLHRLPLSKTPFLVPDSDTAIDRERNVQTLENMFDVELAFGAQRIEEGDE